MTYASAAELADALREQDYVIDADLAVVVVLATRLDRPLLLEGPGGVGKTELATCLAAASGRRLVRLQCYEGLDDGRALYEWDYGKQLLHVQMLRDHIGELLSDAPDLAAAAQRLRAQDTAVDLRGGGRGPGGRRAGLRGGRGGSPLPAGRAAEVLQRRGAGRAAAVRVG